jgi:tetratricopeptide (TPR) repeat protein
MTFLKRASYFGQNEEYICCGGDDGNIFVYSSLTGDLVSCKRGDGFGRRTSSDGIVNGVVPHPSANSYVSYGLDSDAKLWTVEQKDDDYNDAPDDHRAAEQLHKLFVNHDQALTRTQQTIVQPGNTPANLMSTLTRCARIRENCDATISDLADLPSTSLMLAALDDGEGQVLKDEPYGALRFEYCVKKCEEIRERGNVAFHEGNYQLASMLYFTAVQYCLGACFLRAEMREVFESSDASKMALVEELDKISEKSVFEITFPASNFSKRKAEPPSVDVLRRLVIAFRSIWTLFLVSNLNAAQAALKMQFYKLALKFAEQAIEIDPSSSKARFRRASALKGLGQLAEALSEFKRVRGLPEGDTPLVRNCIQELQGRTAGNISKTKG